MDVQIIIRKSKLNYFTLASIAILLYISYDNISEDKMVFGAIALFVALIAVVHNILLLVTPLLIRENEYLIVKPKIPFEKKTIPIESVSEFKANSESQLIMVLKDGKKIKLDMGGFQQKKIEEIKAELKALL